MRAHRHEHVQTFLFRSLPFISYFCMDTKFSLLTRIMATWQVRMRLPLCILLFSRVLSLLISNTGKDEGNIRSDEHWIPFDLSFFIGWCVDLLDCLTKGMIHGCRCWWVDLLDCLTKGMTHGCRTHSFDGMEDEEWGMVQKKGNQFVVGGQPFYFSGFNTYWLMIFAVDQSTRSKVTEVFQEALSVGYTVCRTWAFNDGGWRALQKSPSIYDEEVFKALDFVVSEARKYKLRLILSLVNNWEGYGGRAQYVKWGNAAGLNLTSDDDFFSDATVQGYYKAHVKTILTRVNTYTNITYKDDPTIFAWELINEPRCLSNSSGDKLQAWIQEMAFHVKSIDPMHLLEIGTEGFYGPSTPERLQHNPNTFAGQVGTDFIRNHRALGIDFASAHIYPDSWVSNSISDEHIQFVKTWMQNHIDDAENVLGMPIIFGEFGVSSKDDRFNLTFRDKFIDTVYATQLNSLRSGGSGGGCLLWQLFPQGTEYMDDGYAVVPSKSPSTSRILALHSRRIQLFNSRCSWKCHWGCKKKSSEDVSHVLPHDEL